MGNDYKATEEYLREISLSVAREFCPDAYVVVQFSDKNTLGVVGCCSRITWWRIDDKKNKTEGVGHVITFFRPWIRQYHGDRRALELVATEEGVHVKHHNHGPAFRAEMAARGFPYSSGQSATINRATPRILVNKFVRGFFDKTGKHRWVLENDNAVVNQEVEDHGLPLIKDHITQIQSIEAANGVDCTGEIRVKTNDRYSRTILLRIGESLIRLSTAAWIITTPILYLLGTMLKDEDLLELGGAMGFCITLMIALYITIPNIYRVIRTIAGSMLTRVETIEEEDDEDDE